MFFALNKVKNGPKRPYNQYREPVKYCLADFFHRNYNIKHNDKNGEKKMFWIGRPSIKLLLRPMTTTTKPFVIGPQLCQLLNFAFIIWLLNCKDICHDNNSHPHIVPPNGLRMRERFVQLVLLTRAVDRVQKRDRGIRFGIEQHQLLSETRFLRSCPRRFIRGILTIWFFSRSVSIRSYIICYL